MAPASLRLPSLADRRPLWFGALVALCVGQGIPQGIFVAARASHIDIEGHRQRLGDAASGGR